VIERAIAVDETIIVVVRLLIEFRTKRIIDIVIRILSVALCEMLFDKVLFRQERWQ
jgi:hypothetical protein